MSTLRLRIESLGKGGDSVGRADDGRVVFVEGGVPGDLAVVELTEQKARFLRGFVTEVVEPGAARAVPPCPVAGTCGGCPWQIVALSAQHEAKQQIVERALRKVVVTDPLVPSTKDLGYRGRATMHVKRGKVGFFGRKTHELVAIERCIALDPALDAALQRAVAGDLAAELGEEGTLRGTIAPSGAIQLALEAGRGGSADRLAVRASRLVAEGIAGVLVDGKAYGAALLDAGTPERPFWVSAAGFRQANDAQNEVLRSLVRDALGTYERVLELYCGDGNFTRDLAGDVTAVEEDAGAVARLRKNVPTATAVNARVERDVEQRARKGERFDRVLLDPPRAGAKEAVESIAKLSPGRIVYVSCDPMTLARDLEHFATLGYRTTRATPVDLMPHTDHVEVVAVVTRLP